MLARTPPSVAPVIAPVMARATVLLPKVAPVIARAKTGSLISAMHPAARQLNNLRTAYEQPANNPGITQKKPHILASFFPPICEMHFR